MTLSKWPFSKVMPVVYGCGAQTRPMPLNITSGLTGPRGRHGVKTPTPSQLLSRVQKVVLSCQLSIVMYLSQITKQSVTNRQ